MKNTGYKILKEAPLLKKRAAVESECKCPVCSKTDGIRVTECATGPNTMQNRYECPECGTIWVGNIYDAGWNEMQNKSGTADIKSSACIMGFVLYTLMCVFIAEGSIFIAIPVILFNVVLILAFMLAGAFEYNSHRRKIYLLFSLGFFATIISIIVTDIFIL